MPNVKPGAPKRPNNRCYRGHLVEGPNAKVYPNGKTYCRECDRELQRERYRLRRDARSLPRTKEGLTP